MMNNNLCIFLILICLFFSVTNASDEEDFEIQCRKIKKPHKKDSFLDLSKNDLVELNGLISDFLFRQISKMLKPSVDSHFLERLPKLLGSLSAKMRLANAKDAPYGLLFSSVHCIKEANGLETVEEKLKLLVLCLAEVPILASRLMEEHVPYYPSLEAVKGYQRAVKVLT